MSKVIAPHDERAEACAVGSMLLATAAAEVAVEMLREEDFYTPSHRKAFAVMSGMFNAGIMLDECMLQNSLERLGWSHADAHRYTGNLILDTPSAANVENYCAIVREQAEARALWELSIQTKQALDQKEPSKTVIDLIQKRLDELYSRQFIASGDPEDLHALAAPIAEEALTQPERTFWGYRCGLADGVVDELVGGFQPGHYIVLAARTSMGKSTFAGAIARGVRICNPDAGQPLVVSTEMTKTCMARAALASEAGVHTAALLKRNLGDLQRGQVHNVIATGKLKGVAIHYMPSGSIAALRNVAKRHQRKHGLPLLIVDLAGGLRGIGKDEREQLSSISQGLAALKGELNTCIIACVQLNRTLFLNQDKRPEMHHLKGTGSWEEDADKILFLHRPAYFGEGDRRTEVIQAKDRDHGNISSTWIEYRRERGTYIRALTNEDLQKSGFGLSEEEAARRDAAAGL